MKNYEAFNTVFREKQLVGVSMEDGIMYLGLSELFKNSRSPFEPVDFESLDFTVQEDLLIASEQERVTNEMIDLLTTAIMKRYNCSRDEIYKYWDSFKESIQL